MRSPSSGMSLVETIIGGFLVLTAIAILSALVDNSLRLRANTVQYNTAVLIASNKMEELRLYGIKYGYEQLMELYDGVTLDSEMDGAFKIEIKISKRALYSPSRNMEQPRGSEAKLLVDSVKKVDIRVFWGNTAEEEFTLTDYFGDLYIEEIELRIEADRTSVGGNEKAKLRVIATDNNGGVVNDLSYRWYTNPLAGQGSIASYSRTGSEAEYINAFPLIGDRTAVYRGLCEVVVITKYKRRRYRSAIKIENL